MTSHVQRLERTENRGIAFGKVFEVACHVAIGAVAAVVFHDHIMGRGL